MALPQSNSSTQLSISQISGSHSRMSMESESASIPSWAKHFFGLSADSPIHERHAIRDESVGNVFCLHVSNAERAWQSAPQNLCYSQHSVSCRVVRFLVMVLGFVTAGIAAWRVAFWDVIFDARSVMMADVAKFAMDILHVAGVFALNLLFSCTTDDGELVIHSAVRQWRLKDRGFWVEVASCLDLICFQLPALCGQPPPEYCSAAVLLFPAVLRFKKAFQLHRPPGERMLLGILLAPLTVHNVACLWWAVVSAAGTTSLHLGTDPFIRDPYSHALQVANGWVFGGITYSELHSIGEQVLFLVMLLFGVVFFATFASAMAFTVPRAYALQTEGEERRSTLKRVLSDMCVGGSISDRILSHHDYLVNVHHSTSQNEQIWNTLSGPLALELKLQVYEGLVASAPFFSETNNNGVIMGVVLALQEAIYLPGDFAIRQGEYGHEMFFIRCGAMCVLSADCKQTMVNLEAGLYFGEVALLTRRRRSTWVRASMYSMLGILPKDRLDPIVDDFPEALSALFSWMQQVCNISSSVSVQDVRLRLLSRYKSLDTAWHAMDPEGKMKLSVLDFQKGLRRTAGVGKIDSRALFIKMAGRDQNIVTAAAFMQGLSNASTAFINQVISSRTASQAPSQAPSNQVSRRPSVLVSTAASQMPVVSPAASQVALKNGMPVETCKGASKQSLIKERRHSFDDSQIGSRSTSVVDKRALSPECSAASFHESRPTSAAPALPKDSSNFSLPGKSAPSLVPTVGQQSVSSKKEKNASKFKSTDSLQSLTEQYPRFINYDPPGLPLPTTTPEEEVKVPSLDALKKFSESTDSMGRSMTPVYKPAVTRKPPVTVARERGGSKDKPLSKCMSNNLDMEIQNADLFGHASPSIPNSRRSSRSAVTPSISNSPRSSAAAVTPSRGANKISPHSDPTSNDADKSGSLAESSGKCLPVAKSIESESRRLSALSSGSTESSPSKGRALGNPSPNVASCNQSLEAPISSLGSLPSNVAGLASASSAKSPESTETGAGNSATPPSQQGATRRIPNNKSTESLSRRRAPSLPAKCESIDSLQSKPSDIAVGRIPTGQSTESIKSKVSNASKASKGAALLLPKGNSAWSSNSSRAESQYRLGGGGSVTNSGGLHTPTYVAVGQGSKLNLPGRFGSNVGRESPISAYDVIEVTKHLEEFDKKVLSLSEAVQSQSDEIASICQLPEGALLRLTEVEQILNDGCKKLGEAAQAHSNKYTEAVGHLEVASSDNAAALLEEVNRLEKELARRNADRAAKLTCAIEAVRTRGLCVSPLGSSVAAT